MKENAKKAGPVVVVAKKKKKKKHQKKSRDKTHVTTTHLKRVSERERKHGSGGRQRKTLAMAPARLR